MASYLVPTGDQAQIVALRKEALDLYRRELGPTNSASVMALAKWARSANNLGQSGEALRAMEEGITQLNKVYPKLVFGNWNAVVTYAELLAKAKQFPKAEYYSREALRCLPADVRGTTYEAQSLYPLAVSLRGQNRIPEAVAAFEQSRDIYGRLRGSDDSLTKTVQRELEKTQQLRH